MTPTIIIVTAAAASTLIVVGSLLAMLAIQKVGQWLQPLLPTPARDDMPCCDIEVAVSALDAMNNP